VREQREHFVSELVAAVTADLDERSTLALTQLDGLEKDLFRSRVQAGLGHG
jgi:hypothetical protein